MRGLESQRLLRLSGATPEEAALASFGYTAAEAAEALKASAGELRGAVALLSQRLLGSGSAEQAGEVETAGGAEEDEEGEWLEERVALEAIFGEEHCQFDSRECTRFGMATVCSLAI